MRAGLSSNKDLYDELYTKYRALNSRNKLHVHTLPTIENFAASTSSKSESGKKHEKSFVTIDLKEKIMNSASKCTKNLPHLFNLPSKDNDKCNHRFMSSVNNPIVHHENFYNTNPKAISEENQGLTKLQETAQGNLQTEVKLNETQKPEVKSILRKKFKHVLIHGKNRSKLEEIREDMNGKEANKTKKLNFESTFTKTGGHTIPSIQNSSNKNIEVSWLNKNTGSKSTKYIFGCIPKCF